MDTKSNVQRGYVLVPVNPTDAQIMAGIKASGYDHHIGALTVIKNTYAAMLKPIKGD